MLRKNEWYCRIVARRELVDAHAIAAGESLMNFICKRVCALCTF